MDNEYIHIYMYTLTSKGREGISKPRLYRWKTERSVKDELIDVNQL